MTVSPDADWQEQPVHPDLERDLGYTIVPWDTVTVENGLADYRVLLPTDEDMLKRDAYLIVPAWMVYSLEDHQ